MKLSVFLPALLVGSAAASALLEVRTQFDYTTVLADLKTISAQTKVVTKDTRAFTANDVNAALQVHNDSDELEHDIDDATFHAKYSTPFGDKGSAAVANAVLKLRGPIKKSLNALIKKKPEFDEGIGGSSLSPIVLQTLQQLKQKNDALGAAIVPQLSEPYKSAAPSVQKSIDAQFDRAIAVYSS